MNELKSLSPVVLARLIKAVLHEHHLIDEEFVCIFNALAEASESAIPQHMHCIRNVELDLDDEVRALGYTATELLEMSAGYDYSKLLKDSLWYADDPVTGYYDWSDDPEELKIVQERDLNSMADVATQPENIQRLYMEIEIAGSNVTTPLLDYLHHHPELNA